MRLFSVFFSVLFAFLACSSEAESSYVEGKDFVVLAEPVRTIDPSKIEVAEAFAYPCHACFNFEPLLAPWVKAQHADVNFIRSHVTFRPEWVPFQRGFYTVLNLKLKENIDMAIFNEIHVKHNELNNAQAWANFLAGYGIDKQKVIDMYDSFGVSSQMRLADSRNTGFKISSTPTLVINGKYKVSSNLNSYEETLKVAQFLIDKVRKEKNITQ